MEEIAPGIHHWTAFRDTIGMDVHSYWIEPAGVVLDPMVPPDSGLDWFADRDVEPQHVVLTIGLHWRDTDAFVERFGCDVRVAEPGLERFEGTDREAIPFDFGDEIAPGVKAVEVGAIAPDETALHITHGDGAIAVADALIRASGGGPLSFMPDYLMGDDPESVKAGLRHALGGLLTRDFDTLLMAHGEPIAGGGKTALRDFVADGDAVGG
jgi:hypothetical protein